MVNFNSEKWNRRPTQFPGNYVMHQITISGKDVSDQLIQLDIYESFSEVMTGTLVFGDTKNLILSIPIIGGELLEIDVDDEVMRRKFSFRIFKVSDKKQLRYGVFKYTLSFISEEGYIDSYTKISKSFDRKKYEDSTKYIISEVLSSKKNIVVGETLDEQCFILPYWSPLKSINWFCGRAIPIENRYNSGFVFFENANGMNFISLENLYDESKNKVFSSLTLDPMRDSKDRLFNYSERIEEDYMRFENMNIVESFDILDSSTQGMYANRFIFSDITTKGVLIKDYNYVNEFGDDHHMSGGISKSSFPVCRKNSKFLNSPESVVINIPIQKGNFSNEVDGGAHLEDFINSNMSKDRQMENFILEGSLPGQLEMVVGMQLYLEYPDIKDISKNKGVEKDLWYSGNYMVFKLRRTFTIDRMVITLMIYKESSSLSLDNNLNV